MNKHLFILSAPSSGSTLLWYILSTSSNVSRMRSEGQWIVPNILGKPNRWDPNMIIDWDEVKQIWNEQWDTTKQILIEKSPPHSIRWKQLKENFDNPIFVALTRHPYYFCEGVRRKYRVPLKDGAELWVTIARSLIECVQQENALNIRYEDLTENTDAVLLEIKKHIPDLVDITHKKQFTIHKKTKTIQNMNRISDKRLPQNDKEYLRSLLTPSTDVLEFFGYII